MEPEIEGEEEVFGSTGQTHQFKIDIKALRESQVKKGNLEKREENHGNKG